MSALILAGVAVMGAIGSTLMLSIRIGTLIGKIGAHMEMVTTALAQIWSEIGTINARQDRHVEIFHGVSHDRR